MSDIVFFEEKFQTCIFMARAFFYTLIGENEELSDKIEKAIYSNKLDRLGFIGLRTNRVDMIIDFFENYTHPKFVEFLKSIPALKTILFFSLGNYIKSFNIFPITSFLYTIPGFRLFLDFRNGKRNYQKWCKVFSKLNLSTEEINAITNENLKPECGDNFFWYGEIAWALLKQDIPRVKEFLDQSDTNPYRI